MSVRKTVSLSVVVWMVSGTVALADPLITNGEGLWSFWSSAGRSVTPVLSKVEDPVPPPVPEPAVPPAPAPRVASPMPEVASAVASLAPSYPAPEPLPPGVRADAYLNFGTSPYLEANTLTTGNAQPWYTSPVVTKYFGGAAPNAQQQADFTYAVFNHVKETFRLSGGLDPKITLDPNVPTSHTMSIVSGTSYGGNPDAVGITNVGNNGFSFIDKLSYGKSLDELEWAVAHNLSHELMHAFGVGGHDDLTGDYLDAAVAKWEVLTNPATRFSDSAIADMRARDFGPNYGSASALEIDGAMQLCDCGRSHQRLACASFHGIEGDMELIAPVPEPTTWALWGLAATALVYHRRRQVRRNTR